MTIGQLKLGTPAVDIDNLGWGGAEPFIVLTCKKFYDKYNSIDI